MLSNDCVEQKQQNTLGWQALILLLFQAVEAVFIISQFQNFHTSVSNAGFAAHGYVNVLRMPFAQHILYCWPQLFYLTVPYCQVALRREKPQAYA
jgi:hypothetical protein